MLIIIKKNSLEVECCIRYFFIQSLGSGILILRFYNQRIYIPWVNRLILRYKMGGAPFYFWLPSICEGISWISCYLLIRIQKIIPLFLISGYPSEMVWFVICTRLFIGVIGSFNQQKLKRLIAYSSIHHIGWIIACLLLNEFLWIVYLAIYIFIIYGPIAIFNKNNILGLNFLGLNKEKWVVILGFIRIGGIPPMIGFFLKWWVFWSIGETFSYIWTFMVVLAVLILYIYIRAIYSLLIVEIRIMNLKIIYFCIYKYSLKDIIYIWGLIFGSFLGLLVVILIIKI